MSNRDQAESSRSPGLKDLEDWEFKYDQPPLHLGRAFYGPALTRSITYKRSTGYFNSAMLTEVSSWLDDFFERGGKMQLITSPHISKEDLAAIQHGEQLREQAIDALANKQLEEFLSESEQFSEEVKDRFQLLTGMLERGDLEIKFAAGIVGGWQLFHEKIGYFQDSDGDFISFTGSANETKAGIGEGNVESITPFPSWKVPQYADAHKQHFEDLWENEKEGVYVGTYSEALKYDLFKIFPPRQPDTTKKINSPLPPDLTPVKGKKPPSKSYQPLPDLENIQLKPYQEDAIEKWEAADCRGILKMATGTGKTFTALAAATRKALELSRSKKPLLVIVTAPAVDLVNQWQEEAEKFNWSVSSCHGELTKNLRNKLEAAFNNVSAKYGEFAEMVITTNNSITPSEINNYDPYLLRKIQDHRGELLFIGDEMHSLGTESTVGVLPAHAKYRIGLSATPERYRDPKGTESLFNYFGDPVIDIDIHDAIHVHKALCPYDYFPSFVELTEEETRQFQEYSKKIAQAMHAGGEGHPWVGRRQRVMQHADEKLMALDSLLDTKLKDQSYMFMYSPEGYDPDDEERPDDELAGIKATEKIEKLMKDKGYKVSQYNGDTKMRDRKILQEKLAKGDLDALISMKCLNQGIDVPEARIGVFLSSTKNSQQFVQRRGRILRKAAGKTKAELYDMIVRPPLTENMTASEKRLLRSELSRAAELAYSADNKPEVLPDLQMYAIEYKLENEGDLVPWLNGEKPDVEIIKAQNLEDDLLSNPD